MPQTHAHLLFARGAALYAVPAAMASEVVQLPQLTQVPGAGPHVWGIFPHRGEVLAVVDLARLTGPGGDDSKRAVLLRTPAGSVVLVANRVLGLVNLEGSFECLGSAGVQQHLRGPVPGPDGDIVLIDTRTFVDFLAGSSPSPCEAGRGPG